MLIDPNKTMYKSALRKIIKDTLLCLRTIH